MPVSTFKILTDTMVTLFVNKTLDEKLFKGKGLTNPRIPKSYFSDRLNDYPDAPINRKAADRILLLTGIALRGESKYEPDALSRQIYRLLLDLFGVDTCEFVLSGADDSERRLRFGGCWGAAGC